MCFSIGWIEQLLVWLIIVCAIIAILRLLLPWIAAQLGLPIVTQAINIVLWAIVAIMVVYFCFALIECLIGSGGGFPLLPRSR
jgi:hypothetical protein